MKNKLSNSNRIYSAFKLRCLSHENGLMKARQLQLSWCRQLNERKVRRPFRSFASLIFLRPRTTNAVHLHKVLHRAEIINRETTIQWNPFLLNLKFQPVLKSVSKTMFPPTGSVRKSSPRQDRRQEMIPGNENQSTPTQTLESKLMSKEPPRIFSSQLRLKKVREMVDRHTREMLQNEIPAFRYLKSSTNSENPTAAYQVEASTTDYSGTSNHHDPNDMDPVKSHAFQQLADSLEDRQSALTKDLSVRFRRMESHSLSRLTSIKYATNQASTKTDKTESQTTNPDSKIKNKKSNSHPQVHAQTAPQVNVDELAKQVMKKIDRRIESWSQRTGRF